MTCRKHVAILVVASFLGSFVACGVADGAYDPLKATSEGSSTLELTITDVRRQREIPVLVYLPKGSRAAAVVLFSHGLGGSRHGNPYLGKHWAGRGYVAVFVQHPGSDTGVWQNVAVGERMAAMKQAVGLENFLLRVEDVPAVLDQLERWNQPGAKGRLSRTMDLRRVGMAGHSFGAMTAQAVGGQRYLRGTQSFADPRVKAAVLMSPSGPRGGQDPKAAFAQVKIPWLLMTGTHDVSLIADMDAESRLSVFPALPSGAKYELVLDKAEHSAFSERALPGDRQARNPNHHRAILAISTAFWDAWLRGDKAARGWLDGDGPRRVLEKGDHWQRK